MYAWASSNSGWDISFLIYHRPQCIRQGEFSTTLAHTSTWPQSLFSLSHTLIQLHQTTDPQQSTSHLFGTLPPEVQIKTWTYGCIAMCRHYYPLNRLSSVLQGLGCLDSTHSNSHTVFLTSKMLSALCERSFNHFMTCKASIKCPCQGIFFYQRHKLIWDLLPDIMSSRKHSKKEFKDVCLDHEIMLKILRLNRSFNWTNKKTNASITLQTIWDAI